MPRHPIRLEDSEQENHEGQPLRQAHLRPLQGHPSPRSRHGDLQVEPAPQAAPGL